MVVSFLIDLSTSNKTPTFVLKMHFYAFKLKVINFFFKSNLLNFESNKDSGKYILFLKIKIKRFKSGKRIGRFLSEKKEVAGFTSGVRRFTSCKKGLLGFTSGVGGFTSGKKGTWNDLI